MRKLGSYKLRDLNGEKIDGLFYKAELQKTTQEAIRFEKESSNAWKE